MTACAISLTGAPSVVVPVPLAASVVSAEISVVYEGCGPPSYDGNPRNQPDGSM